MFFAAIALAILQKEAVSGYHVIEGVLLLWQKEYMEWKFTEIVHKIMQIAICLYYIIMLPAWIYFIIDQISYWKWRMTESTGGWSSSPFAFMPVWDRIILKIEVLEHMHLEITLLLFLIMGAILGITKKKKIQE